MAKDKSLSSNPVHDFHKKAKQATIKKSRAEKSKQRDVHLQQKRPESIQKQLDELQQVKKSGHISAQDQSLISSLERDLARIKKLQAEGKLEPRIVSEKTIRSDQQQEKKRVKIPKDPTKSFYYDPIYNPYGVPPPGMEYREKVAAEESGSDSEGSTTSSVARIPMPKGPPPGYVETIARPVQEERTEHEERAMADRSDRRETKQEPGRLAPAQTIYSSEPVLRNLAHESAAFVPKNLKKQARKVEESRQVDPLDIETVVDEPEPQKKRRRNLNIAPKVD